MSCACGTRHWECPCLKHDNREPYSKGFAQGVTYFRKRVLDLIEREEYSIDDIYAFIQASLDEDDAAGLTDYRRLRDDK